MTANNLVRVARCPIKGGPLRSPYDDLDPNAVIYPAEDFTISINTVSQRLFSAYKDDYRAGKYGNDYFVLLSQVGLGNVDKPTLKLHILDSIDEIDHDLTSIWAENVAIVEDYRSDMRSHEAPRLYLSFHSFCQGLGKTNLEAITESFRQLLDVAGGVFPTLIPYTAMGNVAVEGMNNVLGKLINSRGECKEVEFNLYPVFDDNPAPNLGEAPLQTGAYVFFFEDTDLESLEMGRDGIVRSRTGVMVNPYIVVNIKKEIVLSPEQLDTKAAAEVVMSFQSNHGYPLPADRDRGLQFLGAMQELGSSYRSVKAIERYYSLKAKGGDRTPQEAEKLAKLQQELSDRIANFEA
jgi:hypothetical protein